MKPQDTAAVAVGTIAGSATAESLEQIIASAVAAVAVYLIKAGFDWLRRRYSGR
jgi:hypothetical protein